MRILHVPFTYAPDPVGGTEVYVRSLARSLQLLGDEVVIAAPGKQSNHAEIEGLEVYRFTADRNHASAEGVPDCKAAAEFSAILDRVRPDVLHLHANTAAASLLLLKQAKRQGVATVFTYHTPAVSCARGSMMIEGVTSCDGRLETRRCAACVLRKHGVPAPLASALSYVPPEIGRRMGAIGLRGGPWLALRMPQIVQDNNLRFDALMDAADRVVAVCDWVAELLRRNHVREPKLRVSRQGVATKAPAHSGPRPLNFGPLRAAFFGRLDQTKGAATLVAALARRPSLPISVTIYGVSQGTGEKEELAESIRAEARIRLRAPLPSEQVIAEMQRYDLVVVPSQCLETGPLVVLEAFAAGVPVLGSRLGGIAELVRDGVDGLLVEPDDLEAWGGALQALVNNRSRLERLRAAIRPPRTMTEVAAEMHCLYSELVGELRGAT